MQKKIIRSRKTIERSPAAAFLLSLIFTGSGEMYCGRWATGSILFLLRTLALAVLPLYLQLNPGPSHLHVIAIMLIFVLLISLASPVNAMMTALRGKTTALRRYHNPAWYAGYMVISTIITMTALTVLCTFISFRTTDASVTSPVISGGDIVMITRYSRNDYRKGDMLLIKNGTGHLPSRVAALSETPVTIRDSELLVRGLPLKRDALSEEEISGMDPGLIEHLVSEWNENRRYAIMADLTRKKGDTKTRSFLVPAGRYFMACDNRLRDDPFTLVATDEIEGRIEGVLVSPSRKRLLILPFLQAGP